MIVLDTQVLIWLTAEPSKLSRPAVDIIRATSKASEGIAISGSSLWEVAMNFHRGFVHVPITLGDYLLGLERTFTVLPVTAAIAGRSMLFSKQYSRDPTDRIIGATALVHGLKLVTKDRLIRASGEVECVW